MILVDQISKLAVRFYFEYGKPHPILGDSLRLTYIENPGMAFGIEVGGQAFFSIFAFIATIIIFVYILRTKGERPALRVSLALIFGGAVGNLIDRLLYGKVVDFIEVSFGSFRWPIFNMADIAVSVGMIVLITLLLFDRDLKDENKEVSTEKRFVA